MIRHGEHTIISQPTTVVPCADHAGPFRCIHGRSSASRRDNPCPTTAETVVAWFVEKARTHPAAHRAAFRRRVWRDHASLGDRLEVAHAARRLSAATDRHLTDALADLREGVTP